MSMKQVILVNESLSLPRGKLAAQVAHASIASFLSASATSQKLWLQSGMPKIVLAANTEEEIIAYYSQARDAELPVQIIRDAGKTIVASGTVTCIGIGPAEESIINAITGNLKLVG
ncbi:MAG: peptidyl-tRNA hydrolase Pth2 [Candidatus Thiodiazotropha sp. (ex Lucinoma borealis)]|nr:peptidyl-tRNA hydrolase Pth2 [Candidatus Thiodiazotropha sp. (ex Lucinoma borealis)]